MNSDIGKIVSECLNNNFIQNMLIKKREMTTEEKILQEKNFSRMIGYCILFKQSEGIEEYMLLTDVNAQIKFLKQRIANKIGILENEINDKINEIISYAFDNFIKNGYVFHAGNSRSIMDNMQNGLGIPSSTDKKREILNIASIFEKYGEIDPTGWGKIDIVNKREGWFYDGIPNHVLYYANSPEWFNHLCGNSLCYYGFIPQENRYAYENRDYDMCRLNITKLMEKNNMSAIDQKVVLDFFEKCWGMYGDTKPYLAFVPINKLFDDERINNLKKFYLSNDDVFNDIINGGCYFMQINTLCTEFVDANALSCVDLSPIMPRFKYDENSKQRQLTIQECFKKLNGLDMELLLKAREFLDELSEKYRRK